MQVKVHDPVDGIYSTSTDYVHAVEIIDARRILFIAGKMGLHVDGDCGRWNIGTTAPDLGPTSVGSSPKPT